MDVLSIQFEGEFGVRLAPGLDKDPWDGTKTQIRGSSITLLKIDIAPKNWPSQKGMSGSTISTLLHDKINPKDCQVLSLGESGFLQFFQGCFKWLWQTPNVVSQPPFFRGYVGFRECTHKDPNMFVLWPKVLTIVAGWSTFHWILKLVNSSW